MPSFLKDYSKFYGTGEKNEEGLDLEQFLEGYNPKEYDSPSVTADVLVLWSEKPWNEKQGMEWSFNGDGWQNFELLMVKRKDHPCIGQWALPGGFINIREDIKDAVTRELFEETGLQNVGVEQLYTWGEVWRDPRNRIVTTSYLALLEGEKPELNAGDDAKEADWLQVSCHLEKEASLSQNGKEKWKRYYKLHLKESKKGLESGEEDYPTPSAVVLKTENIEGVLKEPYYEVLQSEGLAFDHARFILQALDYLKTLL